MSEAITLTLPDDVLRRAELVAERSRRPVADVLADAIEASLKPLATPASREEPMTAWADAKVLAAAEAQWHRRRTRGLATYSTGNRPAR